MEDRATCTDRGCGATTGKALATVGAGAETGTETGMEGRATCTDRGATTTGTARDAGTDRGAATTGKVGRTDGTGTETTGTGTGSKTGEATQMEGVVFFGAATGGRTATGLGSILVVTKRQGDDAMDRRR